jgi:hypothetical protein
MHGQALSVLKFPEIFPPEYQNNIRNQSSCHFTFGCQNNRQLKALRHSAFHVQPLTFSF